MVAVQSLIDPTYFVVRSRSNRHPQKGYPFGQQLYLDEKTALKAIKKSEFKDLYIVPQPLDKIVNGGFVEQA